ncbi:MAG: ferritin [Caldilineales bacterium]|nr:ferritin [Caldilineales bacterium]
MFSQKLQDAINAQINAEFHSAYIYLGMSAYLEDMNMPGFAHWMRLQYEEETMHALKLYDFMHERGGHVVLEPIGAATSEYASVLAVFEHTLAHEKKVTSLINALYEMAVAENDYPTQVLMQWYISEQVEEEKNASDAVAQLQWVGDFGPGMLMLDREMGSRQPEAE